jgi:hypothetical protein
MTTIRGVVNQQTAWIRNAEASLIRMLYEKVTARYERECASTERLIAMIGECIEAAEPIQHQWLLAPDAIAVIESKRLVPAPAQPPKPEIEAYYEDSLNAFQLEVLRDWLSSVSLGAVILEQDMQAMLDRALSSSGSFGTLTVKSDGTYMQQATMPKRWREQDGKSHGAEGIRSKLIVPEKVVGVDETVGTVLVGEAIKFFTSCTKR